MKFTEQMLKNYSQPLSESEIEKCKNAIRMIRDTLKDNDFLDDSADINPFIEGTYSFGSILRNKNNNRKVKLFLQGSFANNTNVRQKSDVDIAIILESTFLPKYRVGTSQIDYNHQDSTDSLYLFKTDIQKILENKFGNDVERKDKSIKINGNTYRVDADTVPSMRFRDYTNDYNTLESNYIEGIVIYPDSGRIYYQLS